MEEKVRKQKLKRWLTFALRWGIAVAGIYIVLANISFYDRVQVLDPATKTIQKLRVLNNAGETDLRFLVEPQGGGPPREVERPELWVRPDRTQVKVRLGGRVEKVRLLAVKPGDTGSGRGVRDMLVKNPAGDGGLILQPAHLADGERLAVTSPYVEVGINRLVREADTKFLLAAVLIMPLSYLLTSIRWHLLLESLGIRMGLGRSLVLNLVGAFYNAFMPGTTGGDLIKAYYAARQTPYRTRAVLSVVIDRVIGLIALIIVGGAMAALQWHIPDCRRVAVASALIIGGTGAGLVVFYSRRLRRLTGLDFVLRRLPMQRQVQKAVAAMEIYRHRPAPLVVALSMSLPVHMTSILSATFAGWAFRLPLPVFYYWVVVPVVALVGAIPISPQGAGVMEFFAVELTRRHGVTIGQAFVLVMSIRLVQIVWNLVSGVFVLRGGYHAPTEKEQEALNTDGEAAADPASPAPGIAPAVAADPTGVPFEGPVPQSNA